MNEMTLVKYSMKWAKTGEIIPIEAARGIAALWQSSGYYGTPLAAFASGHSLMRRLRASIDHEASSYTTVPDMLQALRAYVDSVQDMYELVIFLGNNGDDYDEWEKITYPDSDGVSTGWTTPESLAAGMAHLMQWENGEATGNDPEADPVGPNEYLGEGEHAGYLMVWDHAYSHASLYRILTPAMMAERA